MNYKTILTNAFTAELADYMDAVTQLQKIGIMIRA